MSKAIHFIGALFAMGLVWFFAIVGLVEWLAPGIVSGYGFVAMLATCLLLAGYPAWRLFVQRRP